MLRSPALSKALLLLAGLFCVSVSVEARFESGVVVVKSLAGELKYVRLGGGVTAEKYSRASGEPVVAWGSYNDTLNENGWTVLEVYSNSSFPESQQARGAGILEGHLTQQRIIQMFHNSMNTSSLYNDTNFMSFIYTQQAYMEKQIKSPPHGEESFWHHVHLLLEQLKGLFQGYDDSRQPHDPVFTLSDFILQQLGDEIGDIDAGIQAQAGHDITAALEEKRGGCSALVKLLDYRSELFISQDTWTGFQTMLRIYKLYQFPWLLSTQEVVPGTQMSFSGYPGYLSSGDDFYQMLPSKLVSQETTNGVMNSDLYKQFISPHTVPEWMRTVVANRIAHSALEWAEVFALHNSGTYNNQWMVLDYKLFVPGSQGPLPAGLLVVSEQVPGYVVSADVTSTLEEKGYWASYNIPYFPFIFNISGYPSYVSQYGDFFSYTDCPRAQIFRRDQDTVTDMDSMKRIMRYNKFQTDPLSVCKCTPPYSGENAIAARSDLNPANGTYPISALGHRCHGATDSKITSSTLIAQGITMAISGPTADDQPPFQWSTSGWDAVPHIGLPDLYNFDWTVMQFPLP